MPPSPHLLWVNSRPTHVSPALWKQWYATEHVPETLHSGMSSRAAFYEETDTPFSKAEHKLPFLALYQTEHEEAMKSPCMAQHSATSALFAKEGGGEAIGENGEFEVRNYRLVEDCNPTGRGGAPPAFLLTVEMHPDDPEEFNRWYSEEHLPMVARAPGWVRCRRYQIGPLTPATEQNVPTFLAVHEVEDLNAFVSEKSKEAGGTEWTKKILAANKVFRPRGWKIVHTQGY